MVVGDFMQKHFSEDKICYGIIILLTLLFFLTIFFKRSIWVILFIFLGILVWLPFSKKQMISRFGNIMSIIFLCVRILFVFLALFIFLISSVPFEHTYQGNGYMIQLKRGHYTLKKGAITVRGTYQWEKKGNIYQIHVLGDNHRAYDYQYDQSAAKESLCLIVGKKCQTNYYVKK